MEEEYYCDFCGRLVTDEDDIELIGSDLDISLICSSCMAKARQAGVNIGPFGTFPTEAVDEIPEM